MSLHWLRPSSEQAMRAIGFCGLLVGCGPPPAAITCAQLSEVDGSGPDNVLIVLMDDIGLDKIGAYGAHPAPARTPNIDQIACAGVRFTNAYANPICSPTRAALLTGRHSSRYGIGYWVSQAEDMHDLPLEEETIPERLATEVGYATAALGKWHLVAHGRPGGDGLRHPNNQGFQHYAGSLGNPMYTTEGYQADHGYTRWEKVTNGALSTSTVYMTTDTVDDAIAQIASLPEPWMVYVALNGAHSPFHSPPADLLSEGLPESPTEHDQFGAMVEATDAEIGRLLSSIAEDVLRRTSLILLSDNGTMGSVISAPWDPERGKGTLFEGGSNVPLIVTGPHVSGPGRSTDALVQVVDVFSTALDIAGVEPRAEVDGKSFLPLVADEGAVSEHDVAYAEIFAPNGAPPYEHHDRMVTDGQWKLIERRGLLVASESLYRLDRWGDGEDLLELVETDGDAAAAYARLRARLDVISEELDFEY